MRTDREPAKAGKKGTCSLTPSGGFTRDDLCTSLIDSSSDIMQSSSLRATSNGEGGIGKSHCRHTEHGLPSLGIRSDALFLTWICDVPAPFPDGRITD